MHTNIDIYKYFLRLPFAPYLHDWDSTETCGAAGISLRYVIYSPVCQALVSQECVGGRRRRKEVEETNIINSLNWQNKTCWFYVLCHNYQLYKLHSLACHGDAQVLNPSKRLENEQHSIPGVPTTSNDGVNWMLVLSAGAHKGQSDEGRCSQKFRAQRMFPCTKPDLSKKCHRSRWDALEW